jgi:hypothetical protein
MMSPPETSAPWRDNPGLHRQRHHKGSRSRLPVRSQTQKKKKKMADTTNRRRR